MSDRVPLSDVVSAYKILFGNGGMGDLFLMPDRKAIRIAYHKKVKLFHPDLAAQSLMSEQRLQAIFLKISNAYNTLLLYIGDSSHVKPVDFSKVVNQTRWEPIKPNVPVPTNECFSQDYYYKGDLPDRKMRFGEYLFYSGQINWKVFMDALIYQCHKRPLLGAICVESGFLDQNDVVNIMNNRHLFECERFGEAAVRLGYLTKKEVSFALKKQFQFGQPFGRYFIDKKLMDKKKLQRLLTNFHHRNMRLSA